MAKMTATCAPATSVSCVDGELFVTGRIKDLIIVSGRNIYPQDVEANVVRADPSLRRAVAFSIPGDGTERLIVVAEAAFTQISTDCTRGSRMPSAPA